MISPRCRFNIILASRQVGKTTMMALVALWYMLFTPNFKILLLANKEATAIEIMKRIRMAYELCPAWLKPGVVDYNKTQMQLGNGSEISISTTTSDAGRSKAINLLLLDEFAFVENSEDFYTSVFPIISSSKKSRIIISSTPNGTENMFYQLVKEAEEGKGLYSLFKIHWSEIPGRTQLWADNMKKGMPSEEQYLQEFELQFLNTGVAAISDELFKSLESKSSPPRWSFDNGEYKIWKEPDPSRVYVQGVDTGEGVGENASVIQIMDITDVGQIEQVAEYWCNTISPQLYTKKVNEILTQWGKPLQMIERNNCGAQVVDGLLELYNYPFVVNWGVEKYNTIRKPKYAKAGVISHTNVKFSAVQNMRYWTNDIKAVILHSKDLVLELKNFVRQANGTWSANPGKLDDRVMAYVWALNILDPLCCQGFFEIIEYDVYGKPKRIQPNYDSYGQKSRLYTIQEIENGAEAVDYETAQIIDPVFGEGTYKSELTRWVDSAMRSRQQEIDMAMMQGWRPFIQETPREAQQNLNKGLGWNLLKM